MCSAVVTETEASFAAIAKVTRGSFNIFITCSMVYFEILLPGIAKVFFRKHFAAYRADISSLIVNDSGIKIIKDRVGNTSFTVTVCFRRSVFTNRAELLCLTQRNDGKDSIIRRDNFNIVNNAGFQIEHISDKIFHIDTPFMVIFSRKKTIP